MDHLREPPVHHYDGQPVRCPASGPADKLNRFFEYGCYKLGVEAVVNGSVGGIVGWYVGSDVGGAAVRSVLSGTVDVTHMKI